MSELRKEFVVGSCCYPIPPENIPTEPYICEYFRENEGDEWLPMNGHTPSNDYYCCTPHSHAWGGYYLYLYPCSMNDSHLAVNEDRVKSACYATYNLRNGHIYLIGANSTGGIGATNKLLEYSIENPCFSCVFVAEYDYTECDKEKYWRGLFEIQGGNIYCRDSNPPPEAVPDEARDDLLKYSECHKDFYVLFAVKFTG